MNRSLKALNTRGILCAPGESLEKFYERASTLEEFQRNPFLFKTLVAYAPVTLHESILYQELDLEIDWLCCCYSKRGLSPWEIAATWMFSVRRMWVPFLQIKPSHRRLRAEVIKHEAVHAARSTFEEPLYEEFLAYATSLSVWRQKLGPILRSSKESMVLILLALLPACAPFFDVQIGLWYLPFLGWLLYLSIRLFIENHTFKKMLTSIAQLFCVSHPLQVALRLSDREIRLFGSKSLEEIQAYIFQQNDIRWHQILSSYQLKNK